MLNTDRLPTRKEMQEHPKKAWKVYNLVREKMERKHRGEYITIRIGNWQSSSTEEG